jgi:DNA-binding response OmpR family regulator
MTTSKATILIVEDDESISTLVGNLLAGAGYSPITFTNANSALEWIKDHKPELIISDIGLPGISGVQFCKILKDAPVTSAIPLIMLTSLRDEFHKVQSLKTGADDYIEKPCSSNELLARIEALLRRCYHQGRTDKLLVSGGLSLNFDTGNLTIDGEKTALLPKEFSLLAMFLRREERILEYAFIAETVWGLNAIATRDTIKVTIHRLKSKLGRYADCIEPVAGLGYKWVDK